MTKEHNRKSGQQTAFLLQRIGAVILQGILRSVHKGCGASAKDTASKTQRWGRIAKVGYKRKEKVGCNRKGFSARCGQNAKESVRRGCERL